MAVQHDDVPLSRKAASEAVEAVGWRYLLGTLRLLVPVSSLIQGVSVATAAVATCGPEADDHLRVDVRPECVELSLQRRDLNAVTGLDTELAHRVTDAVEGLGLHHTAVVDQPLPRPVQMLELAIDALDIGAVRPFWKAVLAYVDEPGAGPEDALVDPAGQLPTIWFQQMGAPRRQRNRIHLDVTVEPDEAEARVRAALDAGGRMVDDSYARAFWVLADAEGNEVCVCTWQDRDGDDV